MPPRPVTGQTYVAVRAPRDPSRPPPSLARQAARFTIVELDPTLVEGPFAAWADATVVLNWQHAIDGLAYRARQLWAIYWEGPGIAGDGLNPPRVEPMDRTTTARAIDGTLHSSRKIQSDSVAISISNLPAEVVAGAPASGLELWEILERAGEIFPVGFFMIPWSSDDVRRIYSAVGVVTGAQMTLATRKPDERPRSDSLDVRFTIRTIGGR